MWGGVSLSREEDHPPRPQTRERAPRQQEEGETWWADTQTLQHKNLQERQTTKKRLNQMLFFFSFHSWFWSCKSTRQSFNSQIFLWWVQVSKWGGSHGNGFYTVNFFSQEWVLEYTLLSRHSSLHGSWVVSQLPGVWRSKYSRVSVALSPGPSLT